MNEIDDYDLIDLDFDEFIRRGMECLQWEAEHGDQPKVRRANGMDQAAIL